MEQIWVIWLGYGAIRRQRVVFYFKMNDSPRNSMEIRLSPRRWLNSVLSRRLALMSGSLRAVVKKYKTNSLVLNYRLRTYTVYVTMLEWQIIGQCLVETITCPIFIYRNINKDEKILFKPFLKFLPTKSYDLTELSVHNLNVA